MNSTPQRWMSKVVTLLFLNLFVLTFASSPLWAAGAHRPIPHTMISPKVSLLGVPKISTVAGIGGSSGYSGDGAAATSAQLSYPWAVAVDSAGNLYISDTSNYVVRVVNRQGTAITVAGVTIQPGNIATVAGVQGQSDSTGDGGAATSAHLGYPNGIAVDTTGNIYISDEYRSIVRKVDTEGIITTVAGNLEQSYYGCYGYYNDDPPPLGDGGAATSAYIACPAGLATDTAGNLYIADQGNGRIRKVDTQGIITTVAGSGTQNNYYDIEICGYDSPSGDGGSATDAVLSCPVSVALDASGNLYIGDDYAAAVRVVNTQETAITVAGVTIQPGNIDRVAGNGTWGYTGDGGLATDAEIGSTYGIAVDALGNFYITNYSNQGIRKVDVNGIITTFAGNGTAGFSGDGGPATDAQFYYPFGLAIDASGNVFVADYANAAIREISGNGGGTSVDFGSVALADNTIQPVKLYINQDVTISSVVANGDYVVVDTPPSVRSHAHSSSAGTFELPKEIPSGVAKMMKKAMERSVSIPVTAHDPSPVGCVGSFAQGDVCTMYVKFTPTKPGPRWFQLTVTDSDQVTYKFGLTGTGVGSLVSITPGIINTPSGGAVNFEITGIARDSFGNMYVSDYWQHAVYKIDAEGATTLVAGESGVDGYDGDGGLATDAHLDEPMALALDSVGNLYIADTLNNVIRKVDVNGIITTVAGDGDFGYSGDGSLATNAELANPLNVMVDKSGNLYIADTFNNVVRKVNQAGTITTIAGDGTGAGEGSWDDNNGWNSIGAWGGDGGPATSAQLNMPVGLALDENGNLFIADTLNSAVRRVDGSGTIQTVAGTCGDGCSSGYSGDGGPATEAQMVAPFGLALDAAGDLYIADVNASSVRKVDLNGVITTVARGQLASVSNAKGQNPFAQANNKKVKAHSNVNIGDGGLATSGQIYVPVFLAVDNSGSFYFTDVELGRVRVVDVTTSDMNFGAIDPGSTSDTQTVTVSNAGNATLNLTQLSIAENFGWGDSEDFCSTESLIESGNSCVLLADFTPPTGGSYSGSIILTDDAFNSPHTISLEGVGTEPDYTITADPTSLTIRQGQTGTATLTVTPQYGYSGTIQFACSGLPSYATCTFSPTSATFDVEHTDPVTVTLTVTTTGPTTTASITAPAMPNQAPGAPLNLWFLPAGLAGVVLFGTSSERRKRGLQRWLPMLLCIALMSGVVVLNGCGSSSHPVQHVTPTGTYSTTVTTTASAQGGSGQHSAPITITIVPYNAN